MGTPWPEPHIGQVSATRARLHLKGLDFSGKLRCGWHPYKELYMYSTDCNDALSQLQKWRAAEMRTYNLNQAFKYIMNDREHSITNQGRENKERNDREQAAMKAAWDEWDDCVTRDAPLPNTSFERGFEDGMRFVYERYESRNEELKPCPFCGSETAPTLTPEIKCVYCMPSKNGCGTYGPRQKGKRKSDIVAAWNYRE